MSLSVSVIKYRRQELVMTIPSVRSWSGQDFVRFRVSRGKRLTIEADGKSVEVAPWLVADASSAQLRGPDLTKQFCIGGIESVAKVASDDGCDELVEITVEAAPESRPDPLR